MAGFLGKIPDINFNCICFGLKVHFFCVLNLIDIEYQNTVIFIYSIIKEVLWPFMRIEELWNFVLRASMFEQRTTVIEKITLIVKQMPTIILSFQPRSYNIQIPISIYYNRLIKMSILTLFCGSSLIYHLNNSFFCKNLYLLLCQVKSIMIFIH